MSLCMQAVVCREKAARVRFCWIQNLALAALSR